MRCAIAFALVLDATLIGAADAWWCTGHMLTGEIAKQLAPDAATFFQPDIDYWSSKYANIATMPEMSCWADDIKSQTSAYNTWHYHDGCYSSDGTACPSSTDGLLLQKLPAAIQALTNSSATQDDRGFWLAMLLHLTGDLHQPLHAAAEWSSTFPNGDAGGNLFHVKYQSNSKQVLHAFCDAVGMLYPTDPPRPFSSNPTTEQMIVNTATSLINTYDFPSSATTFTNVNTFNSWANNSFATAISSVYLNGGLKQGQTLSSSYITNIRAALQSQLSLGGRRLASVLTYLYSQVQKSKATKN